MPVIDNTMRLYHGTPKWFSRPDPSFAKEGTGHSSNGFGFNLSPDAYHCRCHLNSREMKDAVIFAVDLPTDNLLRRDAPLENRWITAAENHAARLGLNELAGHFKGLREALAAGGAYVFKQFDRNTGADRVFTNDRAQVPTTAAGGPLSGPSDPHPPSQRDLDNEVIPALLERCGLTDRQASDFLRGMGADAISTGVTVVVINYDALPPLQVAEVLGNGPVGMPAGIQPGDTIDPFAGVSDMARANLRRLSERVRQNGLVVGERSVLADLGTAEAREAGLAMIAAARTQWRSAAAPEDAKRLDAYLRLPVDELGSHHDAASLWEQRAEMGRHPDLDRAGVAAARKQLDAMVADAAGGGQSSSVLERMRAFAANPVPAAPVATPAAPPAFSLSNWRLQRAQENRPTLASVAGCSL